MVYLSGVFLECPEDPKWWSWVHPHYTHRVRTAPATPPMRLLLGQTWGENRVGSTSTLPPLANSRVSA